MSGIRRSVARVYNKASNNLWHGRLMRKMREEKRVDENRNYEQKKTTGRKGQKYTQMSTKDEVDVDDAASDASGTGSNASASTGDVHVEVPPTEVRAPAPAEEQVQAPAPAPVPVPVVGAVFTERDNTPTATIRSKSRLNGPPKRATPIWEREGQKML